MPGNEPGASTRVIEKLNLKKRRLQWTMIEANERERERMSECGRTNGVNEEENAEKPNERERDCRAAKERMCSSN